MTRHYFLYVVLVVAVFSLLFRAFVVESYLIPSDAMSPALLPGDHVLVSKTAFGVRIPFSSKRILSKNMPAKGEIVVFTSPDNGKEYIRRVSGLPGEKLAGKVNVPSDSVYLESDNQKLEKYNKFIVPIDSIVGRGSLVVYSVNKDRKPGEGFFRSGRFFSRIKQ